METVHRYSNELYHHGMLGQKWGVRRYQNEDRTWTEAGKIRYGGSDSHKVTAAAKNATSTNKASSSGDIINKSDKEKNNKNSSDAVKKAAIVGASIAGAALTAYGAYKLYELYSDKTIEEYVDAVSSNSAIDMDIAINDINSQLFLEDDDRRNERIRDDIRRANAASARDISNKIEAGNARSKTEMKKVSLNRVSAEEKASAGDEKFGGSKQQVQKLYFDNAKSNAKNIVNTVKDNVTAKAGDVKRRVDYTNKARKALEEGELVKGYTRKAIIDESAKDVDWLAIGSNKGDLSSLKGVRRKK